MLNDVELSAKLHDGGLVKDAEKSFRTNETMKEAFDGEMRGLLQFERGDDDYRTLFKKASSPWITQIIRIHSQILKIDGWSGDERLWNIFQRNGMLSKQDFLINECLTYGYVFAMGLPADEAGSAVITPMSPRNTYAQFENGWDIHPQYVIQRIARERWLYADSEAVYDIKGTPSKISSVVVTEHGLGYCPVVRIDEQPTDDALSLPVAPFSAAITTAQALTECRFHIGMVGRHASFPRLWATGLEVEDEDGNPIGDLQANGMFTSPNDGTKFGAFPQADMNGLMSIKTGLLSDLAELTNTPVHLISGNGTIANIGAEALASMESAYQRTADRRKASLGQGFDDLFRMIGEIAGVEVRPEHTVHWDYMQSNSLSQLGDFIVKMQSIGLDREPLVQMIPGYDHSQAKSSSKHAEDHERASNAAALIDLDIKRAELAKVFKDLGYSKEEALQMADYRLPPQS